MVSCIKWYMNEGIYWKQTFFMLSSNFKGTTSVPAPGALWECFMGPASVCGDSYEALGASKLTLHWVPELQRKFRSRKECSWGLGRSVKDLGWPRWNEPKMGLSGWAWFRTPLSRREAQETSEPNSGCMGLICPLGMPCPLNTLRSCISSGKAIPPTGFLELTMTPWVYAGLLCSSCYDPRDWKAFVEAL